MSREAKITAAEHGKLRQFLQTHGLSGSKLAAAAGVGPGSRKKRQVAADLKSYLRNLKKGS